MSEFTASVARYFPHAFTLRLPVVPANGVAPTHAGGQREDSRGLDFVGICTPEGHAVHNAPAETAFRLRITLTSCMSGIFEKHLDIDGLASLRADAGMSEFSWDVFLRLLSDALQCKKGCSTTAGLMHNAGGHLQGEVAMRGHQAEAAAKLEARTRLTFRFQLEATTLVSQLDIPQRSLPAPLDTSTEAYLLELRHFLLDALEAARVEGRGDARPGAHLSSSARTGGILEERGRRAGGNGCNARALSGIDHAIEMRSSAAGLEAASADAVSRATVKANGQSHSSASAAGGNEERGGLRQSAESASFAPGSEVTSLTSEAKVATKSSFAAVMENVHFQAEQAVPATGTARGASLYSRGETAFAGQAQNHVQGVSDVAEAAAGTSGRSLTQRTADNIPLHHASSLAGPAISSRSLPASIAIPPATYASIGSGSGAAKRAGVPPKKRCGGSLVDPRARRVQKGNTFKLPGA